MTKSRNLGTRLVSLALSLVCLLVSVCSVSAAPAEAQNPVVSASVTTTCAVRSYASSSSAVIGRMEDHTAVTVLGEQGDFYKIDCYDMTGYIAKSQIVHKDDKYYVNCDAASSETQSMEYLPHAQVLEMRSSLLALAKKQLGAPYVRGGARPGGFDCSGLTYYLYAKHGITLDRTASLQLSNGIVVAKEGMQVGDLVFFRRPWDTTPTSHVGIYVGNNQIIHAGSKGIAYAQLEGDYFGEYFLCARRIVCSGTAELQQLPAVNTERSVMTVSSVSGRYVK